MKVLLVEPKKGKKYHTPFPPLGLLKLASYHKKRKDIVKLTNGFSCDGFNPKVIYITSLFTYAYEPVHEVIRYYTEKFRNAQVFVGGIYATICSEHLNDAFGDRIQVYSGLFEEAENLLPDYSLLPDLKESIVFSSRGCIRKCSFCSVPKLEPEFKAKKSIRHLIYPGHKKVIFWDNNILASPHCDQIVHEIAELNLQVDFNQGLDARLLTENVALKLSKIKIPIVRLAYDSDKIKIPLKNAINLLKDIGIRGRSIIVYCLYNHLDTPESFLRRNKDLMEWGVVSYPMRYEPLEPRPKNSYISPKWTAEQLEMVSDARRVLGYGGAFPPYKGLKKKILDAKNFEKAFELRPV